MKRALIILALLAGCSSNALTQSELAGQQAMIKQCQYMASVPGIKPDQVAQCFSIATGPQTGTGMHHFSVFLGPGGSDGYSRGMSATNHATHRTKITKVKCWMDDLAAE
jgi:hypothetical protein